jgi:hypothetical protein
MSSLTCEARDESSRRPEVDEPAEVSRCKKTREQREETRRRDKKRQALFSNNQKPSTTFFLSFFCVYVYTNTDQ